MITDLEFDTIRPYTGNEITAATERLSNSEEFLAVFSGLTKIKPETIIAFLRSIHTPEEFQSKFFGTGYSSRY